MSNEVRIVVSADDKASAKLRQAQGAAGGLGKTLGDVGKIAGGFLAANVIGGGFQKLQGFMTKGIDAATRLGESQNAVNQIFDESAASILDWGKANANAFGLSQASFNELVTPLGAMLKNAGLGLKDVSKWSIDLTKRAADMASVFNTDVDEALAAIQAGLRGEQDPLERFGIGLSAARVEARALADTGKDSAKALTDQEKATARLNLIMNQSADTAGDFARTSGEAANAQRIMAARTEELQAKIGQQLIPVQLKWQEVQLAVLTTMVNDVAPWLKRVSDEYLPKLIKAWQDIQPVVKAFYEFTRARVEGVARVVRSLYTIIDGIVKLVSDLVHGRWAKAWADMKQIASGMVDLLLGYIKMQFGNLPSIMLGVFKGLGTAIANAVASGFKSAWNAAANEINRKLPDKINMPSPIPDINLPDNPLPRLAMGGTVRSPLQIVGERGWEIAALPMGTRVFSHEQSRQMLAGASGGGSSIVFNLNFSGPILGDQAQANQLMGWLAPSLRQLMRNGG